jgi:hypothetical protein
MAIIRRTYEQVEIYKTNEKQRRKKKMNDKLTYKRLQVLCDDISLRLADTHYIMNQEGFKKTKEWRAELSMLEKTFVRLSLAMKYFGKRIKKA